MEFISVKSVMPVILKYKENDEVKQAVIHVDYNKNDIYTDLDLTEEIRIDILKAFNITLPVIPQIPEYALEEINKMRSRNFKEEYKQYARS